MAPSILDSDLACLASEVARIEPAADWCHLDVMDGHFVPNLSFGVGTVRALIGHMRLPADVHLMIEDPDRWAGDYAATGAQSVTFHVEAAADPLGCIAAITAHGATAGIALRPGTPLAAAEPILDHVGLVLIMTVEPGFGGQPFRTEMLGKVSAARRWSEERGGQVRVQVDGGVNERTIGAAARAGADTFVAGSAVFRSADPAGALRDLRTAAEQARALEP